jgi:hypothetical protein
MFPQVFWLSRQRIEHWYSLPNILIQLMSVLFNRFRRLTSWALKINLWALKLGVISKRVLFWIIIIKLLRRECKLIWLILRLRLNLISILNDDRFTPNFVNVLVDFQVLLELFVLIPFVDPFFQVLPNWLSVQPYPILTLLLLRLRLKLLNLFFFYLLLLNLKSLELLFICN